ncbi:armadillo-type protein [Triangularia verruculosa]|uniref:Armadillo-type protein n=1 Tax=Triangularia verruculosa TaxID=2587418 RepID=A0AAN7AV08_9PEZI|nr:armadillo-type protein [Triangularia verruculosa]
MISVNLSQGTSLPGWTTVLCLLVGATAACLWFRFPLTRSTRALSSVKPTSDSTRSARPGVSLRQVNPDKNEANTDIDIIAIHGLDTKSPDTWVWVDTNDPNNTVNWLADRRMLPSRVGAARIFTCDWPADLRQQSSVPTTLHESAQSLRDSIQHLKANTTRPILFIASCLGGIILIKALEIDNQHTKDNADSPSLTRATRGVVFLATPFRGTAFKNMPGLLLKALAALQDQTVTALIDYTLGATPDLDELTKGFITLTKNHDYQVVVFWEARNTVLLRKFHLAWMVSTWILLAWLLVNKYSATLSDFKTQRLDRPHVMMNKFAHNNCTNECKKDCTESDDFGHVSRKIEVMLKTIREGSPLEQADGWIRERHYTQEKLKIERLSGDTLSMDRCYINLAIIGKPRENPEKGSEKDAAPHKSPFSLTARLKVETPERNIQVKLSSLFDPRKDSNGQTTNPRRILIHGRAGVGKTTLCKKMVNEFIRHSGEFRKWNELFDRILWVPLRRLKGWSSPPYNLEGLFCYEYFDQHLKCSILAKELFRTVDSNGQKTLFILDGLDEISQLLDDNNPNFSFLKHLLNQPSVIITSRPHVSLPRGVRSPDLELETVGFYPAQVVEYLRTTFDPKTVEDIQSYLEAHPLIQDLVRIPIQLDALCYTWDSFSDKTVPQTMTAIYKAIEENLWKKDIVRLEKRKQSQVRVARPAEISNSAKDEVYLLEVLAFTGMYSDIIDFEPRHRDAISEQYNSAGTNLLLDETLGHLSFLRTSDPSSKDCDRNYHFIHLTFQEYFAARYFIRQWKAKQQPNYLQLSGGNRNYIEPATFLQEHKYHPRYDIFWRFVAGLLDADGEALGFFQTIEEEPRDLLGPTHQRLVMHCLSEVERKESNFTGLRARLENQLEQWLLFECDFIGSSMLAREMECPEQVLVNTLKQASEDARSIFLDSLSRRTAVPSSVINVASPWLNDCASKGLCIAVLVLLRYQHNGLPETILQGIAARLKDQEPDVRRAAIQALKRRADLPEEMLQGIAARLEDPERDVRSAAIEALQRRADLPEEILQGIAAGLKDPERDVRWAAIEALQRRADLPEEILQSIAAGLKDPERDVRSAAIKALQGRADLTEEILQGIAAGLKDPEINVRLAAIEALQGRADLTEEILQGIAARLEDPKRDVRSAVIEALQGRADLPEEILQSIATGLKDPEWDVRWAAIQALQRRADLPEEILQSIAAGLKDPERDRMRRATIQALQRRANLPEEMLQGIAARLEDPEMPVRWAAIKALQGRADLTEEMLQGIAAGLKDQNERMRRATIQALQRRANLPEEMLQGIAARLEDQEGLVRSAAIEALLNQAELSLNVLSPYVKSFCKALLQKSFEKHLYWHASDRGFIGVNLTHISLSGSQHEGKEAVKLLLQNGATTVAMEIDSRHYT